MENYDKVFILQAFTLTDVTLFGYSPDVGAMSIGQCHLSAGMASVYWPMSFVCWDGICLLADVICLLGWHLSIGRCHLIVCWDGI